MCGVCLQGMSRGVELEVVLQRGRLAATCGRSAGSLAQTILVASDSFLPPYGEIFPGRT
jgi:hypothetical protein